MTEVIKKRIRPCLIVVLMTILVLVIPISYSRGYDKGLFRGRQDIKEDAVMWDVAKWGTNTLFGGVGFYWKVDGSEYLSR